MEKIKYYVVENVKNVQQEACNGCRKTGFYMRKLCLEIALFIYNSFISTEGYIKKKILFQHYKQNVRIFPISIQIFLNVTRKEHFTFMNIKQIYL